MSRCVVGVVCLVVFVDMASRAGIRRVVVIAVDVAGIAIVGNSRVRSIQRIKTVVV